MPFISDFSKFLVIYHNQATAYLYAIAIASQSEEVLYTTHTTSVLYSTAQCKAMLFSQGMV